MDELSYSKPSKRVAKIFGNLIFTFTDYKSAHLGLKFIDISLSTLMKYENPL